MNNDNLLFFDIEVYFRNSFVVFKDINKKTLKVFHNDFVGLEDFVKGKTLVGFNNLFYDDPMLHHMMDLKTPYQLKLINDKIIGGERMKVKNYKYRSLDCMQQLLGFPSLKKIEGNLGVSIIESSVPFDIERELTDEEYQSCLAYCEYDVSMTVEVYKMRVKDYFEPKQSLVEMLGNKNAERWNSTTLSANVLMKKPNPKWSNIRVPDEMLDLVPPDVVDLWLTKEKGHVTVNEFNCDIQFGFGGLHGSHNHIKHAENVKLLDVTSLYPNIIININGLGTATKTYQEILNKRIEIKHKDKVQSDALKLILNSVYGNLKNKYSTLNNPKCALTVCAYGQIVLYELCRRLAPFATLVNINTDGVAFIPHSDDYKHVWEQWQKDFNLNLEEDDFDVWTQRDVNNYVSKKDDDVKVKGGDVVRYHTDAPFRNNSARILDIALVDKLLYGKDVLETLTDNLDKPHLYQYILQAGGTYLGSFDNNDVQHNKVNRVFASKQEGFCLYKKRHDLGLVKFPDSPDNMYLWNDECDDLTDFEKIVDLTHYYTIIMKRLEKWV